VHKIACQEYKEYTVYWVSVTLFPKDRYKNGSRVFNEDRGISLYCIYLFSYHSTKYYA
jgi:hypothetical protein